MAFALLLLGLCVTTVCAVRMGVGANLPQACPRRMPLPAPDFDTRPLPVGVRNIEERLRLEELGRRWYRDQGGVA